MYSRLNRFIKKIPKEPTPKKARVFESIEELKGKDGITPVKDKDYFDGKDGRNPITVSNEPPANPVIGDLWYRP